MSGAKTDVLALLRTMATALEECDAGPPYARYSGLVRQARELAANSVLVPCGPAVWWQGYMSLSDDSELPLPKDALEAVKLIASEQGEVAFAALFTSKGWADDPG